MKVCIVAEGCYPYVVGGVSSWINSMIKAFPDIEFVVLAIVANRSYRGKFVYELPENVSEVYELYLEDYDWVEQEKNKKLHLRQNEYEALRSLLLNRNVEWDTLFTLFEKKNFSLNALLMGEDFLNAVRECYQLRYPQVVFSDFLWTMRSIYLPLFLTLKMELPEADLSLCCDRICGSDRKHGKKKIWMRTNGFGAWNLYQGAGGGADPCKVGRRYL